MVSPFSLSLACRLSAGDVVVNVRRKKSHDIRVRHVLLRHAQLFPDGQDELRVPLAVCLSHEWGLIREGRRTNGGKANHDRKATMKENQEKKNTLPYLSRGLSIGMDRALSVTGFTSGAPIRHRSFVNIMSAGV